MREETARWLRKADEDLSDATFNFEGGRASTAAFLAQQAAEKALKAVLIEHQGKFPRIHDLTVLAAEAKAPDALRARLRPLSMAYVAARYPDIEEPVTEADARGLLALAKEVVDWSRRQV